MTRCMGCMAQIPDNMHICKYCGYQQGTDVKEAYYLLPGTAVGEKYMVGKVLGYGGFGVTYVGWDNVLQRKVAVKEYLPSDFATRSYGTKQLAIFSGEAYEQYKAGLESFVLEAKRLAKFNGAEEIVDIYDCFEENGSAYIVMEFLDGVTVKELLEKKGCIPVDKAKKIVMTVLLGLEKVHKEGIIHRDIAPDNIFLTRDGKVKLIDFGAARYATAVQSRSLSVVLKPGYAPEEQYRSRGIQGPWTDMYALGATFYRMITGRIPQQSIERKAQDLLELPSELGIEIDQNTENVLMNSLNVHQEYRIQSAEDFYRGLMSKEDVPRVVEKKTAKEDLRLPGRIKIGLGLACALACACAAMFATGNMNFSRKQISGASGTEALVGGQCYVPDVSGISYEEAEKILKQKNLNVVISGMNYSESIEKNKILSQDPKDGAVADAEETVHVIMSGGNEEVMMPDLNGMDYEEAKELITAQNLVLDEDGITEEYNDYVEKGRIISQSIEAEKRISVRTEVSFVISLGNISEETAVLKVPDLTGLTKEQAVQKLKKLKNETGFTYSIGKVKNKYSTQVAKGAIISQSLNAGDKARTNEPIDLVISKGPQMVQAPELLYEEQGEAEKKLQKAGLGIEVQTSYSSMVSRGLVISQSVKAGAQTAKGSTVTIVVSLGAEPAGTQSGGSTGGGTGSSSSGSSGSTGGGTGSSSSGSSGSTGGGTGNSSSGSGGNTGGGTGSSSSGSSGSTGGGTGNSGSGGSTGGGTGSSSSGGTVYMPDGGRLVIE